MLSSWATWTRRPPRHSELPSHMVSVEVISQTAREGEDLTGKACEGPPVPQDLQVKPSSPTGLSIALSAGSTRLCLLLALPLPSKPYSLHRSGAASWVPQPVATAMGGWVRIPAAGSGHLCHWQGSVDPRGNEAMVLHPLPEALRTLGRCLEGRSSVDTEFQPGSGGDRWAREGPGCRKGPHFILSSDGL